MKEELATDEIRIIIQLRCVQARYKMGENYALTSDPLFVYPVCLTLEMNAQAIVLRGLMEGLDSKPQTVPSSVS